MMTKSTSILYSALLALMVMVTLFSSCTAMAETSKKEAAIEESRKHDSTKYLGFDIDLDSLMSYAKTLVGIPYKYGGRTLAGFDCSGFVNYIFDKVGLSLPRSSSEMGAIGKEIPLSESKKGDIILFGGSDPKSRPIGHAGIIISEKGEPVKFIHSQTSNHKGIVVSVLDGYDYFVKRFVKVVRIVKNDKE